MSTAQLSAAVEFPSSDGQPMAETPVHVETIMLLHQSLQDFYARRPDVFIASDIFWYWDETDGEARIAPDVMVVPGVTPRPVTARRSFYSPREGAIPAAVFEIASKSTWREDLEDKFDRYEELGVPEYFVFDPDAQYLVPPLQAFRLRGGSYRRLRSGEDVYESVLGFKLRGEGLLLRLVDAATNRPVPTRAERALAAEAAAEAERRRADALEAEVERLRARLREHGESNGAGP